MPSSGSILQPSDSRNVSTHFRSWFLVSEPVSPTDPVSGKETEPDSPLGLVPTREAVEAVSLPSLRERRPSPCDLRPAFFWKLRPFLGLDALFASRRRPLA